MGIGGRAAGSFGARGGAKWSRGYADHRNREESRQSTPAGEKDAVLPLSREAMLRAVEAQVCPWCGLGPYKALAGHTHHAHGVNAAELRRLLGVGTKYRLCSAETSQLSRERLLARPDREEITARGNAEATKAQAHRAAADALRAKRQADPRHAQIIDMYSSERHTLNQIAEAVGMHPKSVARIVRLAGIEAGDGRARRWRI